MSELTVPRRVDHEVMELVRQHPEGISFTEVWRGLEDPPPSGVVYESLRRLERLGYLDRSRHEVTTSWVYRVSKNS